MQIMGKCDIFTMNHSSADPLISYFIIIIILLLSGQTVFKQHAVYVAQGVEMEETTCA